MSIDAMKLALGALESAERFRPGVPIAQRAITALRQAIEQAEQAQPVAWMDGYRNIYSLEEKAAGCEDAVIPLYTTPPPRQPLTAAEICRIKAQIKGTLDVQFVVFARAIEAAHGIKGKVWI
jgi:hypothetical protein